MLDKFIKKSYFWQLRELHQCDSDRFKEIQQPEKQCLYIFKTCKDVIVRIAEPIEKIHGWSFKEIQVLQRLNDNPRIFHWKRMIIPFKGQIILTLLKDFNQSIIKEIQQAIPRQTQALKLWIQKEITDIFQQKSKSQMSFGHEHAFIEIKTLHRTRYKNYFESNRWTSETWQYLLQMANSKKILQNNSHDIHLLQIDSFINEYQTINNQRYQNMFQQSNKNKKVVKVERQKDNYQIDYQNSIMKKYHLYQYLQAKKI